MSKRILTPVLIFILIADVSFSQSVIAPNYGLKSHETLEIKKVETTAEGTAIYMSVVNRIKGGSFCADRNIFIRYPDGSQEKLIKADGIPVCPAQFKFRYDGERLDFVLRFPRLREGTAWIDIIEMCNDNCFSFYGVTLDNDLNNKLNSMFVRIGKEPPADIIPGLVRLIDATDGQNAGSEGLLYITAIKLYKDAGDNSKASEFYARFLKSGAPELQRYIRNLNSQGIRY